MGFLRRAWADILTHKPDYVIVFAAIVLTALVRITPAINGGFPFLFDHGRDMLEVRHIVVDHHPTLIGPFTGLKGVFQGPLHFYLLTIPFVISGGNPAANIVTMGFFAILGTFLCYYWGREMYGRIFGIILALFFALSPASISFSTIFWNPNWIPFFMIPFYYFLYKGISKDSRFLMLCGLVAGIIAQFELAFGGNLVIVFTLLCMVFVKRFYANKYFWFSILIFLLSFAPQVLFDLKHDFLMSRSIVELLSGNNISLGESISFPTRLIYRLDEFTKATIYTVSGSSVFRYLFFGLITLYVGVCFRRNSSPEWSRMFFFIAAPLWFFIFFLIYPRPAWEWYWIGLQVSYYFLLAYVLSRLMKLHQIVFFLCMTLILVWCGYTYYNYWGHSEVVDSNPGTFKNEMRIIDAIYADSAGKPFGVFVYTPPIYDFNYNYLFWWRGLSKYKYIPNNSKDGLFYLIIEKDDPKNPYGSDGWKKTVIKSGSVVWSKTFPGGVVVEKRQGDAANL